MDVFFFKYIYINRKQIKIKYFKRLIDAIKFALKLNEILTKEEYDRFLIFFTKILMDKNDLKEEKGKFVIKNSKKSSTKNSETENDVNYSSDIIEQKPKSNDRLNSHVTILSISEEEKKYKLRFIYENEEEKLIDINLSDNEKFHLY